MAKIIEVFEDNKSFWYGMDDYLINLKKSNHSIELTYAGEPPHGDSYHQMKIDGLSVMGFFWGCNFLFPSEQNYAVCPWMSKLFERKTIIIDLTNMKYHIFKDYWDNYKYENGILVMENNKLKILHEVKINEISSWEHIYS